MNKKKLSKAILLKTSPTKTSISMSYILLNKPNSNDDHESSVIKTTGNCSYGNATVGEKAIEFQRYASNTNFTLNLLHSVLGVDYFNIPDSSSYGFELLNFFEDPVLIQRPDRSVVLEWGDCVIMDNCGFHHGLFVEQVLRRDL